MEVRAPPARRPAPTRKAQWTPGGANSGLSASSEPTIRDKSTPYRRPSFTTRSMGHGQTIRMMR